jgi:hypothetical protein
LFSGGIGEFADLLDSYVLMGTTILMLRIAPVDIEAY